MGARTSVLQKGGALETYDEFKKEADAVSTNTNSKEKLADLLLLLKARIKLLEDTNDKSENLTKLKSLEEELEKKPASNANKGANKRANEEDGVNEEAGENEEGNEEAGDEEADGNEEGNEEAGDKNYTPEKCEEILEKPSISTAQERTESEVLGFFGSFLSNWATAFKTLERKPTQDEIEKDKCKDFLDKEEENGKNLPKKATPATGEANTEAADEEATTKPAAKATGLATTGRDPCEGYGPYCHGGGGSRRKTHKNRTSRRKTRKVEAPVVTSV
jgi:hypothetical protein